MAKQEVQHAPSLHVNYDVILAGTGRNLLNVIIAFGAEDDSHRVEKCARLRGLPIDMFEEAAMGNNVEEHDSLGVSVIIKDNRLLVSSATCKIDVPVEPLLEAVCDIFPEICNPRSIHIK